ncbi:hypothetical protein CALVIDRAFT_136589 [Calocera viscosa TUFC12733]|uniref:Uncharacterized protein n=1 Tax=Calocera viscosa (strain TUFC12733) TaxID=1330018 RepID=A0A167LYY6_CALVF|nr:hypothetical protein CALVIDRAFT_136589 [Calocera viscosa TUFC12733]
MSGETSTSSYAAYLAHDPSIRCARRAQRGVDALPVVPVETTMSRTHRRDINIPALGSGHRESGVHPRAPGVPWREVDALPMHPRLLAKLQHLSNTALSGRASIHPLQRTEQSAFTPRCLLGEGEIMPLRKASCMEGHVVPFSASPAPQERMRGEGSQCRRQVHTLARRQAAPLYWNRAADLSIRRARTAWRADDVLPAASCSADRTDTTMKAETWARHQPVLRTSTKCPKDVPGHSECPEEMLMHCPPVACCRQSQSRCEHGRM